MLLLGACERGRGDYYGTTKPRHGPEIIWSNLGTEPEWLDPGKASDSAAGAILTNVFEGLTELHPVTLQPMPAIAKRWDVRDDGRTYVFHLRPSTWSDGKPLTAHDFEWSWKRVLDQATASKYASFLYPLRHADAYHQQAILVRREVGELDSKAVERAARAVGPVASLKPAPELGGVFVFVGGDEADKDASRSKMVKALDGATIADAEVRAQVTDRSVVGVRALDDATLEVRLEDPLPFFLDIAAFYTTKPVPRHVIERLQAAGMNPDLWTRPENIVCNGAYTIEDWKFRQYYVLRKNERYWDAAHVRTPRVRLALVENQNTALNLYQAGELDYIGSNSSLPSEFMDHLKRYADFRTGPYLVSYFYFVNTKSPPFDDVRVRQALRFAIDRRSIVEHVTRAGQIPNADLVPEGVAGYHGPRSPVFDPERARALLAEAGYPGGKGFPKTTLIYNTSEGHKQIAEAVQQMWHEQLGIEIEIENQEWKVYLKRLQAMDFQLARMGWVGDYADPYTFLELLTPENGNNHSNWDDANYASLVRRANAEPDRERRLALLHDAEVYAMAAAPVLPIYTYTRSELIKPYLMGSWLNYQNHQLFKYWWVDMRWVHGRPARPDPNEAPPLRRPEPGPTPAPPQPGAATPAVIDGGVP